MRTKIQHLLAALHRDERGSLSVTQMLIMAMIGLALFIVLFIFRRTIIGWVSATPGLENTE